MLDLIVLCRLVGRVRSWQPQHSIGWSAWLLARRAHPNIGPSFVSNVDPAGRPAIPLTLLADLYFSFLEPIARKVMKWLPWGGRWGRIALAQVLLNNLIHPAIPRTRHEQPAARAARNLAIYITYELCTAV